MPIFLRPFANTPAATASPYLVTVAQALLWHGIAPTTRKSYLTGRRSYERFCVTHGFGADHWPASSDAVCVWLAFLFHHKRLAFATIKHYLAGVSSSHTDIGVASIIPSDDRISRVLRGIKSLRGAKSATPPKLPITFAIIRRIAEHVDLQSRDHCMLLAAMWVGTAALLRTGEFAVANPRNPDPHRLLLRSDLTLANGHWFIHLRASKTDPFREGVSVPILALEATTALQRYLSTLPTDYSGPLFAFASGVHLGRDDIVAFSSRAVSCAGVAWTNPEGTQCKGVSFRKGGASSLASVNTPDRVIQIVGRWKSGVYRQYIHESAHDLASYFSKLEPNST